MKTLKQIKEEYNNNFLSQFDAPEEISLEESKSSQVIPSSHNMPQVLLFRRVSYRLYPGKQVVALYYSKMLNKYLSIPFGPEGNLNLSEAVITDTIDEACWKNYKMVGMKKKGNKEVPNCVPVEEQGSSATRYTERPTYESFKERVERLRNENIEEGIVGDTIEKGRQWAQDKVKDSTTFKTIQNIGHQLPGYGNVKAAKSKFSKGDYWGAAKETGKSLAKAAATGLAVAGAVGAGVVGVRSGLAGAAADALSGGTKDPYTSDTSGKLVRDKASGKSYSSWSRAPQAAQKVTVKENKISDIRKMINEGLDTKDISINGRDITLNTSMAKRILEVYDSVNTKNKKIVEDMLNEDMESFKKLLNFSIRN